MGLVRPNDYRSITYLNHESIEIEGVHIFASPYTPSFNNWSYMRARRKMHDVWYSIPDDVNILVTHGPPKGILDLAYDLITSELFQCGCTSLLKRVKKVNPSIHAFGHIHDHNMINNFGCLERDGTKFINCSVDRHHTEDINPGVVIDYN